MFPIHSELTTDIFWINVLLKVTLLLSAAWLVHFLIPASRAQWRVAAWRVFALSLICLPIMTLFSPKYSVSLFHVDNQPRIAADTDLVDSNKSIPIEASKSSNSIDAINKKTDNLTTPIVSNTISDISKEQYLPNEAIIRQVLIAILLAWCIGITILLIRILYHQYKLVHEISDSTPVDEKMQNLCGQYASQLGCRHNVKVRISSKTDVPYIYGCFNPMIILPQRMSQADYLNDLASIFAHELSHICNHDLFWMACFRFLHAFLWIHPLVWGIRRSHEKACEYSCDLRAAQVLGNTDHYAGSLAKIALEISNQAYALNAAPMVRSSKINSRLRRLANGIPYFPLSLEWIVCFLMFWGIVVASLSVLDFAYANQGNDEEQIVVEQKEPSGWNAKLKLIATSDSKHIPKYINHPGKGIDRQYIPDRDPKAGGNLIDLTDYYNAGLIGTWQTVDSVTPASLKSLVNDLADIPSGIQEFDDVQFDIRGVVQLLGRVMKSEGALFPEQVRDIKVDKTFEKFHVLHATSWQTQYGMHIGSYIFNYSDDTTHECKIIYGNHLLDWWRYRYETLEPENTVIAWQGANDLSRTIIKYQRNPKRARIESVIKTIVGMDTTKQEDDINAASNPIRLFKTTWKNPRPDVQVKSIDYISKMTNCAPFLVAITVE